MQEPIEVIDYSSDEDFDEPDRGFEAPSFATSNNSAELHVEPKALKIAAI